MKKNRMIPILFCIALSVFSQDMPSRVAVLPFQSLNTSETDTLVIAQLFEASLVSTGVFQVLEQNRINEILDAQALSLTGCYDESCAVEVGELLSAEQIILGALSRVGGRYVLTAKLIDVARGTNLKADKVSADSLEDMIEAAEVLANRLAGLEGVTIIRTAGSGTDIFIETDPSGAEVFVNGRSYGTSPVVAEDIPAGTLVIEASMENLWGSDEFLLDANAPVTEYEIRLEEARGNILVKGLDPELRVSIDDMGMGTLDNGYLKNIPVGRRRIEIVAEGLYFSETVMVEKNSTLTLTPLLIETGSVEYTLPEGVEMLLISEGIEVSMGGKGHKEHLPAGDYLAVVTHPEYVSWEFSFPLIKNQVQFLEPELQHTREWEEADFTARYNRMKSAAEAQAPVSDEVLEDLSSLAEEISSSPYDFDELKNAVVLISLKAEEANQMFFIGRKSRTRKVLKGYGWTGTISGALLAGGGGAAMVLADIWYEDYSEQTLSGEAETLRSRVELMDAIGLPLLGTGGALLISGILSLLLAPDVGEAESGLEDIRARLERAGAEQ